MFEKILLAGTRFYKNPRTILGLSLVLTLLFALGIPQMKFDNDVRSMLPAGNSEVAINNYYENEDQFGNSNLIFIGIESHDAYSPEALGYNRDLRTKIEALNESLPLANLAKLLGLSAEEAVQVRGGLGALGWNAGSAEEILKPLAADPAQLAATTSLDPALAGKVAAWARQNGHSALELFRVWEAPIKTIQSLTDADDIVNEDDTLKVKKLIEGDLTPEAIATLKAKVAAWPVYQDALVSRDGTLSSLLVTLANPNKTVQTTVDKAIETILAENKKDGFATYLDGESVIADQIGKYMFADMSVLMPLVVLVVLGILFLSFRRWEGVVYPSIVILISVVWSVGLMAWLGIAMNVVSVAMPVLLVAISSAYAIHQMNHYFLDPNPDRMEVLVHNMKSVGLAITLSGITVMVGFGALVIESFVPIRNFGIFTAVGDIFAVFAALFVLPAFLLVGHKPKNVVLHEPEKGFVGAILQSFASATKRRPGLILAGAAVLTVVFALGTFLVKSELNSVSFFKADTPIRLADDKLNDKLAGTQNLNVILDSDLRPVLDRAAPPADGTDTRKELTTPEVLKKIDAYSEAVTHQFPFVTKVVSFNDMLKKMNKEMTGGGQAEYRVPDSPELISQYLLLFSGDTQSVLTPAHDKLKVTLNMKRTTSQDVEDVRQFTLKYFEADWQKAQGVQVQVTGTAHLYNVANDLLVHGNIESLFICLAVVFLLLLFVLRSFWMTLIALLPIFLTLAVNFGVLGFFGIPLNSGTAMVSSIAIGIGVDYSIHYITWYRNELRKGRTVDDAVTQSILHKGRAILYNMFVIFGGFIVLAASSFVPLVQFGVLVSLCMVTTAIGALVVVPAMIHLLAKANLKFLKLGVK
jgi:predicted RND superfamily exporter protein